MKNRDSMKTYGIVGAILIFVAYAMWAYVFPALSKQPSQDTINSVTEEPIKKQENPARPTGESAMPSQPQ